MKLLASICACLALGSGSLAAERAFPVGERITYRVKWGGIRCGTSSIRCEKVDLDGREVIRIRVRAQSTGLASLVYPVEDTVDCYIDPDTGLSFRLVKDTTEGGVVRRDVLELDRKRNTAHWVSKSENDEARYAIEPGTCDAVSFLYAFREERLGAGETRRFHIAADRSLHGLAVRAGKVVEKSFLGGDKVACRRHEVIPERDDLFVRKIPKGIWVSEDKRRLVLRMDIQMPVGTTHVVLEQYQPPRRADAPSGAGR